MRVCLRALCNLQAFVLNNMATAYDALHRYDDALGAYREVLAVQRTVLGPAHPDCWVTMRNVALSLENAGRHDEALAMCGVFLDALKAFVGVHNHWSARVCCVSSMACHWFTLSHRASLWPLIGTCAGIVKPTQACGRH